MPGIVDVPRFRKRRGTTKHAKASGRNKYQDPQTELHARIHDFRQERYSEGTLFIRILCIL